MQNFNWIWKIVAVSTVWPWGFIWEFGEEERGEFGGRGGDGKEGEGRIDSHLVCKCRSSNFGKLQEKKDDFWGFLKNPQISYPLPNKA